MDAKSLMLDMGKRARKASADLLKVDGKAKKAALMALADLLEAEKDAVFAANAEDLKAGEASGLDGPRMKRLKITEGVLGSMVQGCREVAAMSDPVGEIESMEKRPNGMLVGRMRVPLGVIAMIFESRPNAVIEASILCLLAGNAVILRGGSEARHSNMALAGLITKALESSGMPRDAVQVVPVTDREAVNEMLKLSEFIDVVIPRGGEGLIRAVAERATMPVLKHYKGVCHIYVHADANLDEAVEIIFNSKVQSPGVCNALECLLVHKDAAPGLLPRVAKRLGGAGVRFRACPASLPLLGASAEPATDADWGHEYLDLILAVRTVGGQTEAQDHIAAYGSNHTEAILTADYKRSLRFLREVDAALVVVNASTRFNDGGQLGLGAEIGISTSKLHAYGVMGVKELTTTKFVLLGEGQIRQ